MHIQTPPWHGEGLALAFVVQDLEWMPTRSTGAAALQIEHIVRGLTARQHQLTLFKSAPGKRVLVGRGWPEVDPTDHPLTFAERSAFHLAESAGRRIQTLLRLPWAQVWDSARMVDVLRQRATDIDLIYERNSMYGIGAAIASRRLRKPYVLHVDADFLHEHDFLGMHHTRLERLIAFQTARYNYRTADRLTTVSSATRRLLVDQYGVAPERIEVIPNGAVIRSLPTPQETQEVRAELGLDDAPVVGFMGSFFPWHGIHDLVDAFAIVSAAVPTARLLLIGDGETRPAVEAQVHARGLTDRVHFTGRVPHTATPRLLSAADVVVAPYPRMTQEFWGSPMKLFEYMAAARPTVASQVGDFGQILEDGRTGLLTEPGNAGDLAAAIRRLLDDPHLRNQMGKAARTALQQRYTWDCYLGKLQGVFEAACRQARNAHTVNGMS